MLLKYRRLPQLKPLLSTTLPAAHHPRQHCPQIPAPPRLRRQILLVHRLYLHLHTTSDGCYTLEGLNDSHESLISYSDFIVLLEIQFQLSVVLVRRACWLTDNIYDLVPAKIFRVQPNITVRTSNVPPLHRLPMTLRGSEY